MTVFIVTTIHLTVRGTMQRNVCMRLQTAVSQSFFAAAIVMRLKTTRYIFHHQNNHFPMRQFWLQLPSVYPQTMAEQKIVRCPVDGTHTNVF